MGSAGSETLRLHLRTRVEAFKGSGEWEEVFLTRELPAQETALLLCDVWDKHWCEGATRRVGEMVSTMNEVVALARNRGVQIVHAPSDTLDFYADSPHRQRILAVPRVAPPEPLAIPDAPLPIDDSDSGCDTGQEPWYKAWTRQHPAIEITGNDVISDNGAEVYSLLRAQGISHLILMGVHTNMCVLGRSFAIRQMTRWGIRCLLLRDLTDALYNPAKPPFVDHFTGTELVIQHIERYWCPTLTSADFTGKPPFRFAR